MKHSNSTKLGLQLCNLKIAFLHVSFVTTVWEGTLLLTLVSQLPAMQTSQLLHEALLCLHAVLLACNQTPDMPFMLPWPTPQCLSHAHTALKLEMRARSGSFRRACYEYLHEILSDSSLGHSIAAVEMQTSQARDLVLNLDTKLPGHFVLGLFSQA